MQEHRQAIHVDQHLAVNGSGGAVFALGDAATVEQPHVLDHAEELFQQADVNNDGVLSCSEVRTACVRCPHQGGRTCSRGTASDIVAVCSASCARKHSWWQH